MRIFDTCIWDTAHVCLGPMKEDMGTNTFFKIFEIQIQILLEKYISNTKYKYILCKAFEIPVKVFESSNKNTLEKDFKYKYFLSRVFQIQILIPKKVFQICIWNTCISNTAQVWMQDNQVYLFFLEYFKYKY